MEIGDIEHLPKECHKGHLSPKLVSKDYILIKCLVGVAKFDTTYELNMTRHEISKFWG